MTRERLMPCLAVLLLVGSLGVPTARGSSITFVEYATDAECRLYTVDPASQTPCLLLDLTGEVFGQIKDPAFSPNGHRIAFSSEQDLMSTPWRSNLWVIDSNGGNLRSVTHLTPGSFPANSPTGIVEGTVYEDGQPKDGAWIYVSSLPDEVTADAYGYYRIDDVPVGQQYVTAYDPVILYDGEDFGFSPITVVDGMTSPGDVTLTWDWDNQQGVSSVCWEPSGNTALFIDNSGNLNRIHIQSRDLYDVVDVPAGVSWFDDAAVRTASGEIAVLTSVFYGDYSLEGVWLCAPDGSNMHQIVEDEYAWGSLHWSQDAAILGYTSLVYDQQSQLVSGVPFYDDQGTWLGGIAMDQGYSCEFGGWDPTGEYVCLITWDQQSPEDRSLITVRLSDYTSTQLYNGDLYCASWGPETSAPDEGPGPAEVALLGPAYPNPTRGPVTVHLLMEPATRNPSLKVYDALGRQVSVASRHGHLVRWDGRDAAGKPMPPGTYVLRLEELAHQASTTVTLVR